jgi:NAD-dependent SIR2 family protein deacetylase
MVESEVQRAFSLIRNAQRVLILLGAGASTSCGLPDFRSASTGLYADPLLMSELGDPQLLFDARVFREEPDLLWSHLGRLLPATPPRPGAVHAFLAALASRGRLLRLYTQNVDGLERAAGVPPPLLVEAHGHLRSARCVRCGGGVPLAGLVGPAAAARRAPACAAARGAARRPCGGVLRPEVAFFHEALPAAWDAAAARRDAAAADLVLVVGTSLRAEPLSHLPAWAPPGVPRVLVNAEDVAPPRGAPFSWAARLLGDAGAILWAALQEGGDPAPRCCGGWRAGAGGALVCGAPPPAPPTPSGGGGGGGGGEGALAATLQAPPGLSRAGRPLKRARSR